MSTDAFLISTGGVVVWRVPEAHPLLARTDTSYPDFVRKAGEVFPSGPVEGLPRVCSENSEDAATWFYFSPLLDDPRRRAWVLARLLREAFPGEVEHEVFSSLAESRLHFWQGKDTGSFVIGAPPGLGAPEGRTEVDVIVTIGDHALVFIEAKYRSGLSERTTHSPDRDQVIRNLDVGSWFARDRFERFYLVLLQYGDHPTNIEAIVGRYLHQPRNIREQLTHRGDLTSDDLKRLSQSLGFVRWPDPLGWREVLLPPEMPQGDTRQASALLSR